MIRIRFSAIGFVLQGIACASHAAETFPAKPIRVVVASAPGGLVDVATRLVVPRMAERLGQPMPIENQAGAGTLLGIRMVKAAPADGYTLLATSNTITILPSVKLDPGYELLRDFIGIGPMVRSPWVMVVGAGQPDTTLAGFVGRARADAARVSFASGGVGTAPYLAAQSFLKLAGLDLLHVPYKGNGAAMPDLISGRVTMMFEGVGSGAGKLRAGQLRALGVSAARRLTVFPEIPTIAEQGYPGFESYVYILLLAPAGTPPGTVDALARAMRGATAMPVLRDRFEADGIDAPAIAPEAFAGWLKGELAAMGKLVTALGLPKD